MWYLTTYQIRISFHVDQDNFGIISQVEWHAKSRKQDKIKIFLKPKCENGKE